MTRYFKPGQIDPYEAEVVEDIPEQFDLNRYKPANTNDRNSSYTANGRSVNSNSNNNKQRVLANYDTNHRMPVNQPASYMEPYQTLPSKNTMSQGQGHQTAMQGHYPMQGYARQHMNQNYYSGNGYAPQMHGNVTMHRQPNYVNREGYAASSYQKQPPIATPQMPNMSFTG